MNGILGYLNVLCEQAYSIWLSGGWAMMALVFNALVMFGLGMHVYLKLNEKGFRFVSEKKWRRWIDHPKERKGPIGELLNFMADCKSIKQAAALFKELRATETVPFERDLRVLKICVAVAPLLGLLGTVTGMLTTFSALSSGGGGDKTMGMVAKGISEALITTETGLVIALPGLFFQYQLSRKHDKYKSFLAHFETVFNQKLYKNFKKQKVLL